MNITFSSWVIPTVITAVLLGVMFRPYRSSGAYDFGSILRLLWVIPICVTWMLYMGVLLWVR